MQTPGIELEGPYKSTSAEGGDGWWYGGGSGCWASLTEALSKIPASKRIGLTIGVNILGKVVEYWWSEEGKVLDSDIKVKTTDLIDAYSKEEVDAIIAAIPVPDKASLGIDNVDNTPDALKPVSLAVENALKSKAEKEDVEALIVGLNNLKYSVTHEFSEFLTFTYLGSNNKIKLAFEPKSAGVVFLSSYKLNPFFDYRFEGGYIILRQDDLIVGRDYILDITYQK